MPPTSRAVRTELENLLAYLTDSEIALYVNLVRSEQGRVSWRSYAPGARFLYSRIEGVSNYRHWVETGAYSALLADGSLLQMSYDFAGRDLVGHRLAYVPCPFAMDPDLLLTEPILDVFDAYAAGHTRDVVLNTVFRFDFNPERAGPGHPAVHLTFNGQHCRIACAAPLRVGQFVDFVFRNFYPELWQLHPYLGMVPKRGWGVRTVTQEEMQGLHVSWAT